MNTSPPCQTTVGDIARGAIAGCIATVPMTWSMKAMHRELSLEDRYHLPPQQITMRLANKAGITGQLNEEDRVDLTLLAHFGAGTAAGALYAIVGRKIPLPGPLAGAVFGVGFWAGNCLGLLPALGILRPATEHPPKRTGLMVAAHVVWGAVAGTLAGQCGR